MDSRQRLSGWNANASGTLTDALYVNDNNTLTMSGVISGASATANTTSKTGNGILILNNDNTYSSPTVVSAGTLLANKTKAPVPSQQRGWCNLLHFCENISFQQAGPKGDRQVFE